MSDTGSADHPPEAEARGNASARGRLDSGLPSALEAMRRRLEEHSPLEALGPLFGPEAQGRRPAAPREDGRTRSGDTG